MDMLIFKLKKSMKIPVWFLDTSRMLFQVFNSTHLYLVSTVKLVANIRNTVIHVSMVLRESEMDFGISYQNWCVCVTENQMPFQINLVSKNCSTKLLWCTMARHDVNQR